MLTPADAGAGASMLPPDVPLPEPVARLLRAANLLLPEAPAAPRPNTTTTTSAPTTTTTTTQPPVAVPSSVPVPALPSTLPARVIESQTGQASWYEDKTGRCAHRTAPMGTVVTVVRLADGKVTRCTVTNRGPYGGGRVIDLAKGTFAELAPPSVGVVDVRIEW